MEVYNMNNKEDLIADVIGIGLMIIGVRIIIKNVIEIKEIYDENKKRKRQC
jgi:hypothetical protein